MLPGELRDLTPEPTYLRTPQPQLVAQGQPVTTARQFYPEAGYQLLWLTRPA